MNPRQLGQYADEAGDAVRQTIRAYHGSPHDFDRFDASKIGTGEGAQAYGHGLYFAGDEDLARKYRDDLKDAIERPIPADLNAAYDNAWATMLKESRDRGEWMQANPRQAYPHERRLEEAHGLWADLKHQVAAAAHNPGRVYEVEIAHPEEALLDLDVPVAKQTDRVRDGLARVDPRQFGAVPHEVGDKYYSGLRWKTPWDTLIGHPVQDRRPSELTFLDTALPSRHTRAVYADLAALAKGSAPASEALRSSGIPGLQYFDGASRRAMEGTRNYVMFPGTEDSIRILRKYAIPGAVGTGVASQYEESP